MLDWINTLVHLALNLQPPLLIADIPVEIPAPNGLTEIGYTNWNRDKHLIPDWRDFPKQGKKCQGLKNLVKMLNSTVGYRPPLSEKICKKCDRIMLLDRKRRNSSKSKCSELHNGDCLKIYSEKVKDLVGSIQRCHNPRCSNVPMLSWLKNQKAYCSVECIEGYQEWNNEVNPFVPSLHNPLQNTQREGEILSSSFWDYLTNSLPYYFWRITNNVETKAH